MTASDASADGPTSVLVVGLGSIGRRHAAVVRQIWPSCRVVALRRPSSETSGLEGVVSVYSLEDALHLKPSVAVVASPAPFHLHALTALVEARVPTLVEKPIAVRSEGVRAVLDRADKLGVTIGVGYNLRFAEGLRVVQAAIAAGRIGRTVHTQIAVGQYLPDWRPDADYRTSVSATPELGGGVLHELSHELDYARWLFGPIVAVRAHTGTLGDLGIDVPDTAHLILEHSPGSRLPRIVTSIVMDFLRRDGSRRLVVVGTEGTLEADLTAGKVQLFSSRDHVWSVLMQRKSDRNETYEAEWRDFAHAIETGTSPACSGLDGLETLLAVEAAARSAASGSVVPLQSAHDSFLSVAE